MKNYLFKLKPNFNPLKFYALTETRYYIVEDDYGNEIYTLKMTCDKKEEGISSEQDYEIYDKNNNKLGIIYIGLYRREELRLNGNIIDYYSDITDRSYIKPTTSFLGGVMNGFREVAHSKDLVYGLKNRHWTIKSNTIRDSSGDVIAYTTINDGEPGFIKQGGKLSLSRELSQNDFFCVLLLALIYRRAI